MVHWLYAPRTETRSTWCAWLQTEGLLTRVGCTRARRSWCLRRTSANRYRRDSKCPMHPPQVWRHALWLYIGRACSAVMGERETDTEERRKQEEERWMRDARIGAEGQIEERGWNERWKEQDRERMKSKRERKRVNAWNLSRGIGNTSICSPLTFCFDANLGEIIQWSNWKKRNQKKTFHCYVCLDGRQINVMHMVNKYISVHNSGIILPCSTNSHHLKCLAWWVLAQNGWEVGVNRAEFQHVRVSASLWTFGAWLAHASFMSLQS